MRVKLTARPPWSGLDPLSERAPLQPRCSACRREIDWEGNPHRPFCSLTCRLIDLGVWLDEAYRIPAAEESPPPDPSPGT